MYALSYIIIIILSWLLYSLSGTQIQMNTWEWMSTKKHYYIYHICISIYSQIKHETELKPTLHIGWIQETFLSFSRFSGVCGMYSSGCEALSCRQHFILSNSCAAERQPRMSLSHKVSRCVKTSVQKKMSMGVSLLKALDMRHWLHTCLLLINRPWSMQIEKMIE